MWREVYLEDSTLDYSLLRVRESLALDGSERENSLHVYSSIDPDFFLEYRGQVESHETLPNLKKKGTESL
jgi:hypothetical protein